MSLPTLVIIHGGWHTPPSYTKLTSALRAAGPYEVHLPRLPSTFPTRPPTADLSTDTFFIKSYVSSLVEAGRTVVVLMHSYGGQVGTNALHGLGVNSRRERGLAGGVAKLIYLCAFALPEGKSMGDKVKEFGHEELMPLVFDFDEDGSVLCRDARGVLIGDVKEKEGGGKGLSEEEIEEYLGSLVRWNGKCMSDPLTGVAAWREIEVVYVYTRDDVCVPLAYQESMVRYLEGEGRKVETVLLETGHAPGLVDVEGVVGVVGRAVGGV